MKEELKTQKEIRFEILRKLHKDMRIPIRIAQKIVDLVTDCYDEEAMKWVKFIESGMKSEEDLLWEKFTGNTLTYDEKIRECLCVFIKHFFNLP